MRGRQFRTTTILIYGLVSFLIGLVLGRKFAISFLQIILAVLMLTPLLWRRNILSLLSVIFICLSFGSWRGGIFMKKIAPYQTLSKQLVTIRATATSDSVYGENSQIEFSVGSIQLLKPYESSLIGSIEVRGYGENMIYHGDIVEVSAKLYPTRGSKQASLGYAKIARIRTGTSQIDLLRRKFASGLQSVLPEPQGSFGLGLLIGQRTTLPESLNDQLSDVGLTHIVAVSGYNLTIMVNLAHRLARKRSKYQTTILTIGFIGMFLIITGSSASIVRAAVVSILSIWAWFYGRTFRPSVLILLAAALTAGWFPPYIWSDVGWYLSFLAFIGVLIIAPIFQARFIRVKQLKILRQLLIETTAAQFMTLPIILYIFGKLSLIALLANMLVVPATPIAMGLSFVAGLAGMIIPNIAGWFAWPATIIMTYMLDTVDVLAKMPKSSIGLKITSWQMVFVYTIVFLLTVMWWRKSSKNGKVKAIKVKPLTEPILID